MRVWSVTDRGLVRSENQDACAVLTPDGYTVAVVCDGMGGTQGGRMASAIAVETFTRELSRSLRPGMSAGQLEQAAGYAVALSNDAVREYGLAHPGFERMGTTLVSAVVRDDLALVSNVGDSRAYRITRRKMVVSSTIRQMVARLIPTSLKWWKTEPTHCWLMA